MDSNEIVIPVDNSNTKKWYTSKTVWFNALTVLVTVATFFGYVPGDYQHTANQVSTALVFLVPLVNIVLRAVTTKAIR